MKLKQEEIIHCESYYDMVDYHYQKGTNDLPGGVVHVDTDSIPDFFEKIDGNGKTYVVVSSRCDFGVGYQMDNPTWKDVAKAVELFITPAANYKPFVMPPRCDLSRCNQSHLYTIKCHCWTSATFPKIPGNVKSWFLTNSMIRKDSRIIPIPFGIFGTDGSRQAVEAFSNIGERKATKNLLYVNFQFYTSERFNLYKHFEKIGWATTESGIDFENFIEALLEHLFILCPNGNGIDCYRTCEALYAGAIPVMERSVVSEMYESFGVPILIYDNLFQVNEYELKDFYTNKKNEWNYEKLTTSYWKQRIEDARKSL